jgi:hypothetical protein
MLGLQEAYCRQSCCQLRQTLPLSDRYVNRRVISKPEPSKLDPSTVSH